LIAVDTNILLYAHREDSPWHDLARERLDALANSGRRWAIPWPCFHEFLAIATHPRIFSPPTPAAEAVATVDGWMRSPTLDLLGEDETYFRVLRELLQHGRIVGAQVHDARIAALCLHHGISELWTADRDFGRFPELRTRNPLHST
jgi:hypothetical protein